MKKKTIKKRIPKYKSEFPENDSVRAIYIQGRTIKLTEKNRPLYEAGIHDGFHRGEAKGINSCWERDQSLNKVKKEQLEKEYYERKVRRDETITKAIDSAAYAISAMAQIIGEVGKL